MSEEEEDEFSEGAPSLSNGMPTPPLVEDVLSGRPRPELPKTAGATTNKISDTRGGSSRHIVPSDKGGWDVKKPNASRASSHHETQADAVASAKEVVSNSGGGEIIIQSRDDATRSKDIVRRTKSGSTRYYVRAKSGGTKEKSLRLSKASESKPEVADQARKSTSTRAETETTTHIRSRLEEDSAAKERANSLRLNELEQMHDDALKNLETIQLSNAILDETLRDPISAYFRKQEIERQRLAVRRRRIMSSTIALFLLVQTVLFATFLVIGEDSSSPWLFLAVGVPTALVIVDFFRTYRRSKLEAEKQNRAVVTDAAVLAAAEESRRSAVGIFRPTAGAAVGDEVEGSKLD
ncbi:DUF2188 domain-containing protein [Arthrobacter sp. MDT2-16]